MSELGIPKPTSCDHPAPVFGCSGCIDADRAAFAKKAYEAWKATYKLPKCPSCGEKMLHYGYNHTPTKVEAEVICSRFDTDGAPTCEDEDMVLVIA